MQESWHIGPMFTRLWVQSIGPIFNPPPPLPSPSPPPPPLCWVPEQGVAQPHPGQVLKMSTGIQTYLTEFTFKLNLLFHDEGANGKANIAEIDLYTAILLFHQSCTRHSDYHCDEVVTVLWSPTMWLLNSDYIGHTRYQVSTTLGPI